MPFLSYPLIANVKQHAVRTLLSLLVIAAALLHVSGVSPIGFLNKLENFSYDLRLNLLMSRGIDPRVVIVDIDEKSLSEQGRWPWGRNRLAAMVDTLFDYYHIDTLGFDVVFAEKDESSGLKNLLQIQRTYLQDDAALARAIEKIKPQLDYDQVFADSLKGRKVVLGYYFLHNQGASKIGQLPQPVLSSAEISNKDSQAETALGFGANLASLQEHALAAGHFNPQPEKDGITRKVALLTPYQGGYYDALSVAVAKAYFNQTKLRPKYARIGVSRRYSGLESIVLADKEMPVDDRLSALVPYRGGQGSFPYVSASDVLNQKVPADTLQGKIVLVGTTAPGLMDLRATPVQSAYPGVEIHANLIAGILDSNIKARPGYMLGAEFIMVLLAGFLLIVLLNRVNPARATLVTLVLLAVIVGSSFVLWQFANLVLPLATSLVLIGLLYILNMSYGFFVESRGKRQLARVFGHYVPPELVEEMAGNPESINLAGESRDMTVLFCDIRGFTTIAEQMDPAQLSLMMSEFLTPLTQIIHQNRGTIDKYMGDAIMAFWGAPLKDPQHARNALQTALQMQAAVKHISDGFVIKGWPPIEMGFGLNSGNMVVGNMGSRFRMAYTVMGDAVNLASRLEGLTKLYDVNIIVSEAMKDQVPEFAYRYLDTVRVKGKDKAVAIFEPLDEGIAGQLQDELVLFREAIRHYRNQDWDLAEMQLLNLQKISPARLYALYIQRIAGFRKNPPDDLWDGVFNLESK
ncbi:MAG TPA: adenylate/guanylate cyclase domain-containing protein [Methylophilus sp.]|nr:adenylate/guanylate cyclase domain-containing protein [Methylophilus sp.]HQQ32858.1 adenylate/guanylate cyclase domain-containing protein [Methylophilus sp.]